MSAKSLLASVCAAVLAFSCASAAFAQSRPAPTTLAGGETFMCLQSGTPKDCTPNGIRTYMLGTASSYTADQTFNKAWFGGSSTFGALLNGGKPTYQLASNAYVQFDPASGALTFNSASGQYFYLDSSGNLHTNGSGGFVGAVSGNASTASALATGRTLSLSSDCTTGSPPTFDGSANVSISATCNSVFGGKAPLIHVANNTALGSLATTLVSAVVRDGYSTAGDAPSLTYVASTSACSNADNGAQVASADGKCWVASFPLGAADVREWGAKLDGITDDGGALRKACKWSAAAAGTVNLPSGKKLLVNSLDPSGLAGLVVGDGSQFTNGCTLKGQRSTDYPDAAQYDSPIIQLGGGLNRPLVLIQQGTNTPAWQDVELDGNRNNQTGCTGPGTGVNYCPANKLYTVVIADVGAATNDTSVRLDRVAITGGYNGDIYIGAGRGTFWAKDSWFHYSGQSTSDFAVFLNGFDTTLENVQVGSNAGTGIILAEGSQYQIVNGAVFLNGAAGMEVNGGKVNYLSVVGTNIQNNGCIGIKVDSSNAFSGQWAAGHQYTNVTFDGNSYTTTNTCSDFYVSGSQIESLISPNFIGYQLGGAKLPKYNIEASGGAQVRLVSPLTPVDSTGARQNPYGTAFTNCAACIVGSAVRNVSILQTWTPTLSTDGTVGTPTYAIQAGTVTRNNNQVTISAVIQTSAWSGPPTGNLIITGLPYGSSNTSNLTAACSVIPFSGWTAATGYGNLAGFVGQNATTLYLYETGSGKTATPSPVADWATGAMKIMFTCTYPSDT